MRINFTAALTVKAILSSSLWAGPVPQTNDSPAKGITQLLRQLSSDSSFRTSYHYACQALTSEYGLEVQLRDGRSSCKYLNRHYREEFAEEFIPLYPDEDTLYASAEDFLKENNGYSKSYWEFANNTLSFVNNKEKSRKHILLPRDVMISSGSGAGPDGSDKSEKLNESGAGMNIDIGATAGGAALIFLAGTAIGVFIVVGCRDDIRRLIKGPPRVIPH